MGIEGDPKKGLDRKRILPRNNPDRRDVLRSALAFALGTQLDLVTSSASQAGERLPRLSEHAEKTKQQIIRDLVGGIRRHPRLARKLIPSFAKQARNESELQAYLDSSAGISEPDAEEVRLVRQLSDTSENGETEQDLMDPLGRLTSALQPGEYGHYLMCDLRKLYLVQKDHEGALSFVYSLNVSPSARAYSKKKESGGMPLGMHRVGIGQDISDEKLLGEVVSMNNPHKDDFLNEALSEGEEERTFTRHLDGRDRFAEMITARLLVIGPDTQPTRGANLHATNFENLLGTRASGGCGRLSNVGIKYLFTKDERGVPFVRKGTLVREKNLWTIHGGTPLMIYASPKERDPASNPSAPKVSSWVKDKGATPPPNLPTAPESQAEKTPPKISDWVYKLKKK